jgi:hypothetical protein
MAGAYTVSDVEPAQKIAKIGNFLWQAISE